ncbi:MAG TPA: DUF547 domain-containing protein [Thermoanaerobaculia bacterium]|nr:DUF547 domain-containing protein [Thermoanaerobaculia bacterium]
MPKIAECLGTLALIAGAFLAATSAQAQSQGFSHQDWNSVVSKYVDARGRVNYQGLSQDRSALDRYVAAVEKTSPRSNPELFPTRNDSLAYYLNAYNAMVFKGVLARWPDVESVWYPFGTGLGFFVNMDIKVGGQVTNLKRLEDDIVRGEFKDPRVHAALNCASLGCPILPQKAFEPATLDADLDAGMRGFVAETRNCAVDPGAKSVRLSKIFDWFAADFLGFERRMGNTNPKILDYLNRYRAANAQIPREYSVGYFDYDKSLNKQ